MRTVHFTAIAMALGLTAAPALAQDPAAAIAQQRSDQIHQQQSTLHNDVVDFRWMSGPQQLARVAEYRKMTEPHRLNALQIAEQAKTNPLPAGTGPRIRDALQSDLGLWQEAFGVSKRDFQAMSNKWLVPAGSLTDQQWAAQRANWFAARDAWIDAHVQGAQNVRP